MVPHGQRLPTLTLYSRYLPVVPNSKCFTSPTPQLKDKLPILTGHQNCPRRFSKNSTWRPSHKPIKPLRTKAKKSRIFKAPPDHLTHGLMEPQCWLFHTLKVSACSLLFPLSQFFYYFFMPSLSMLKVFMFFLSIICSFSCFIFKYSYFSLYTSIFLVFGDFNDVFKKDELFLYWASSTWPTSTLNFVISTFSLYFCFGSWYTL